MASPTLRALYDSLDKVPVKSSNVAQVAYSDDFARLFVEFKGGRVYCYSKVPRGVYEGLLAAPSKGKYVYRIVRHDGTDSVYSVEPV